MPPVILGITLVLTAIGVPAGAAAFLAPILLSTGVSLAVSGVAKLIQGRPKLSIIQTGTQFNVRQPIELWRIIYGRINAGGVVTYIETTGANKEFLHLVLTLASHEVGAIGNFYFDSKLVPKAAAFKVWIADRYFFLGDRIYENSIVWVCIQAGRTGLVEPDWVTGSTGVESDHNAKWKKEGLTTPTLANSVTIEKNLGSDSQAAFPNLVADSAGLWTSNHRQRGRAGVHLRLTFNSDIFPTGIPTITFDIDGKKVDDPRVVAAAEVSENPALCILDYLLLERQKGGCGVVQSQIDEDSFIAAANICDEEVFLRDSGSPLVTEKRYTLNGIFDVGEDPFAILGAMLSSCAGRLIKTNGKYRLFVGVYVTANPTAITEGDLRGPIALDTRTSIRDLFNGVKGIYISPANYWQPSDFHPYQGVGYVAEDEGNVIWKDIELPFTQSPAMAQRLAKIMLERARRQITITLPCKLSQYSVAPLDTIKVSNERFGWTDKTFEVVDVNLATETGDEGTMVIGVDIIARETDSNVYAWDPDTDETVTDNAGLVVLPDQLAVEPVTNIVLLSNDSTSLVVDGIRYPRILATWDVTPDQFVIQGGHLEVYLKKDGDTIGTRVTTLPGDATEAYIGPTTLEVGEDYSVEVVAVAVNAVRAPSGYSSLVTVSMTSSGVITGAGNRTYRPLTNPITATDAGASATINIASWSNRVQGVGDISYNSGSITGLSFNTLYYIYFDDPNLAGGTITYVASETKEDALIGDARFFVGSCRTPVDGGPDTVGNDDGGAGAQSGINSIISFNIPNYLPFPYTGGVTVYNPTTLDPGSPANVSVTNPVNASNTSPDDAVYCEMQRDADSLGSAAIFSLIAGGGNEQRFKTLQVKVRFSIPTNSIANDGSPKVVMQVLTGFGVVLTGAQEFQGGDTEAAQDWIVSLPPETNLAGVMVRFIVQSNTGQATGSVVLRIMGTKVIGQG